MIKRLCQACGAEMRRGDAPDTEKFFCETCNAFTGYDEVDMEGYCPDCEERIVVCKTCSQGYFCERCNSMKSSKRVIWKSM